MVLVPEMLGFGLRRLKADIEKGPDEMCIRDRVAKLFKGVARAAARLADGQQDLLIVAAYVLSLIHI